jgi:hypothetical protein
MATEYLLSEKLKVVVYYGGRARGRCYDFVDMTGPERRTRTLTEEALLRVIHAQGEKPRG